MPPLIDRGNCILTLIDVQEKLLPVVGRSQETENRCDLLLRSAACLKIPTLVTEQYPQGLGTTVPKLRSLLPADSSPLEKVEFSGFSAIDQRLAERGRAETAQVILAGLETHICVTQTAFELQAEGRTVFVVSDAVSARSREDHQDGLRRLRTAGVQVVPTESVVFEWLRTAEAAEFREISRLIRDADNLRRTSKKGEPAGSDGTSESA